MDWISLLYLAAIVAFWTIVFVVALYMTRRSLSGVGELSVDETAAHAAPGANGHIPVAKQSQAQLAASNNGSQNKR